MVRVPVTMPLVQLSFTGCYRKRKAIYEVFPIDEDLADEMKRGSSKIDELLKEKDIPTLAGNTFRLFKTGQTSIEEVYSILLG